MASFYKAEFSFVDFKFQSFEFIAPEKDSVTLGVGFKSTGVFASKDRNYALTIEAKVMDDSAKEDIFVKAKMTATFNFEKTMALTEIPDYFFTNSIAIVFPYLRAFISNLALQANWEPMIIPILNLSQMAKSLKENTTEAEH